MPTYETLFITLPNLSEEEEKSVVSSFEQVITERFTMVANERMGRRRLAYPIKKFEDGVYTRFLYDADETAPKELDRRMRISDRVLRHLTVRLEEDWAVAAKEQAVRDAEARAEAEARRAAEASLAAESTAEEAASGDGDVEAPEVEEAGVEEDDSDRG